MKYFIYALILLAFGTMAFNASYLNFENVFSGDSSTALIGILASFCVVLLCVILLVSKKIQEKHRNAQMS